MSELPTVMADDWAKDLTYQQELFVLEYVAGGCKNATAAARAAGVGSPHVEACKLLARPSIAAAVRYKMDEINRSFHLTPDRILRELAATAGFDIASITTRGRLDFDKLEGEHTKAIAAIEPGQYGTKVKAHDKTAAIRLLMDHLGMLKSQQTNVQVVMDFGDVMARRRARTLEVDDVEN